MYLRCLPNLFLLTKLWKPKIVLPSCLAHFVAEPKATILCKSQLKNVDFRQSQNAV